jgi:pullulanase/glycogen debranching enzyme
MADAGEHEEPFFSSDERAAGFALRGDVTWFLFDPDGNGVRTPNRVVLTGAVRGWSQDMDDVAWQLQPVADRTLWVLRIENPNFTRVPPSSPFKFRVDEGDWVQPPDRAPNREAGNLIYAPGIAPIRLHAEVRTANTLWFRLTGDGAQRSLDPKAYRLMTDDGREIVIAQVLPNTASDTLLCLGEPIDPRRVFFLEYPRHHLKSLCKRDGWYRTMYSPLPLGAEIAADGSETTFRVFAPRAERIGLYLYRNPADGPDDAIKTMDMVKAPHGIWEVTLPGDLHGIYYDMTVHGPVERGNKFFESHPEHITDPYARVSLDSFGKARVWRATRPAKPLAKGRPAMQDVIAYEVHVQDFTSELPVPEELRGTFPAMAVRGLTNAHGEPIGVVHLMPVQEFLHYPDDEWQAAFRDDPFMKQQGVDQENYDWGYRTTHAFAIESRFRQRGTEHGAERNQLRDLVEAFHEHGIAVLVDIVPNHTGENMDGRNYLFNFGAIDTDYYYRTNDQLEHIGPYGNEVKFEDRPMAQRWLIDQCHALIHEIGIDGFRIDLAGQIDKQTLIKLREELGPDILIYGEPWIAPSDPDVARSPDWGWYKKDAPITFFQDDARNAFKGPVSDPVDKYKSRGFAGGNGDMRGPTMRGLLNDFEDEANPNQGINYLDIHDNWALADQFARQDWDGRFGVDQGPVRIAAGLLLTSLGPVVLHGGTEFLRSKGSAGSEERTMHTASGPLAFHGKRDTYNVKTPNLFVWDNVGRPLAPETGECDYRKMQAYWAGLIAMRLSRDGEVFRIANRPPEGYYRWLLPENTHLLGYVVANQFLVLVNASEQPATFHSVTLESGVWKMVSDGETVDHVHGVIGSDAILPGGQRMDLTVPAQCMKIWLRSNG